MLAGNAIKVEFRVIHARITIIIREKNTTRIIRCNATSFACHGGEQNLRFAEIYTETHFIEDE